VCGRSYVPADAARSHNRDGWFNGLACRQPQSGALDLDLVI
jgi:hypothetical protein